MLESHTGPVFAVALTPDGSHAVSASHDTTVKVWDTDSGNVIATFSGESVLLACAISPDGLIIVAGEASGSVHFLQLEGEQ